METNNVIYKRMKYMFSQVWLDKRNHYRDAYYFVPVWFAYGKIMDVLVYAVHGTPAGMIANFSEHLLFYTDPAFDQSEIERKMWSDRIWVKVWSKAELSKFSYENS